MNSYRIHARIEPDSRGYIARVWVSNADDPDDREVAIAHACHPCSLEEAKRAADEFIAKLVRELLANGQRVSEVRVY